MKGNCWERVEFERSQSLLKRGDRLSLVVTRVAWMGAMSEAGGDSLLSFGGGFLLPALAIYAAPVGTVLDCI